MATIRRANVPTGETGTSVIRWAPLAKGDEGEAIRFSQCADKSAHVYGTFGGAAVRLEGCNDDGGDWQPLTDVQGVALDFTAAKLKQVTEIAREVRPRVIGGDESTSLTVALCMRQQR